MVEFNRFSLFVNKVEVDCVIMEICIKVMKKRGAQKNEERKMLNKMVDAIDERKNNAESLRIYCGVRCYPIKIKVPLQHHYL